jgi:ABC-type antimicrobial peptide transport system permease subunit
MRLVAAGALLGSVLAMALAEWMRGEIWGIGTKDIASWGLALAAVLGVGMLACLAPAWLGARVQPAEVLRAEN